MLWSCMYQAAYPDSRVTPGSDTTLPCCTMCHAIYHATLSHAPNLRVPTNAVNLPHLLHVDKLVLNLLSTANTPLSSIRWYAIPG